jgi:ATP-dependent exoDNAse (exonuclease V) alpha subunit
MRIRSGTHTASDLAFLNTRLITNLEVSVDSLPPMVHLVASNKQAQIINATNLNGIESRAYKYKSNFTEEGNKDTCTELTRELHTQFNQKGINEITLKLGARVMLIKNLSVEEGLVNGSVGTISKFEVIEPSEPPYPRVKFDNGVNRLIVPVEWELELSSGSETSVSKATQLPLMLCWAITIHKSQSLTLDQAIMDLSGCFCEHQVYVALSRVRGLNGLYLESFDPKKIVVNRKVVEFLSRNEKQ